MAERYLIASGNVSDPANWFGGNKPTVGDVAHANGFVGQVDEDITATTWTTAAGATAVAGGGFVVLDGFTMTGNVVSGTTRCVTYNGSTEAVVDGFVLGGSAVNADGLHHTGTGHLRTTGDAMGSSTHNARGVRMESGAGGSVTIGGRCASGPAQNREGLVVIDNGNHKFATVEGNIVAAGGRACQLFGSCDFVCWGSIRATASSPLVLTTSFTGSVDIYGSAIGADNLIGSRALQDLSSLPRTILIRGGVIGGTGKDTGARPSIEIEQAGAEYTILGSVNGGVNALDAGTHGNGIRNLSTSSIDVKGSVIGGPGDQAHGILNESTGIVRVGGQSIDNPSGALGVSNPGGGTVTTEYLAVADPAYFPDVRAGEGSKVLVTLLKNSVNASTLVTGTPTVEVFDFESNSVFGEPKELTLEDGVYSYQHPTNVMTPRKLYYARVEAVIDDEARDLMERPFVAQ